MTLIGLSGIKAYCTSKIKKKVTKDCKIKNVKLIKENKSPSVYALARADHLLHSVFFPETNKYVYP